MYILELSKFIDILMKTFISVVSLSCFDLRLISNLSKKIKCRRGMLFQDKH